MQSIGIILGVLLTFSVNARTSTAAYQDFYRSLKSGDEASAELNAYYFLRNYPKQIKANEVAIELARIYQRQSRNEEAILWLKTLSKDTKLKNSEAAKLSFVLSELYTAIGNKSAAEIQKSLLRRNYANTAWGKKVLEK